MLWKMLGQIGRRAKAALPSLAEKGVVGAGKTVGSVPVAKAWTSLQATKANIRWGRPLKRWAMTPSPSRHAAVTLGVGALGYASSDSEDTGQRVGRGIGFMLAGNWASRNLLNNRALGASFKNLGKAMDAADKVPGSTYFGGNFANTRRVGNNVVQTRYQRVPRTGKSGAKSLPITRVTTTTHGPTGKILDMKQSMRSGMDVGEALKDVVRATGVPKKWGAAQSLKAGAMYGLMSDETSLTEGMVLAGTGHVAGKSMAKHLGSFKAPFRSGMKFEERMKAAAKLPLIRTMASVGAFKGALDSTDGETFGTGILTGAAGGALKGAGIGLGAKAFLHAPLLTTMGGMAALQVGAATAGAIDTIQQSQVPYDLHADGEFALALHRTRHGY